MGTESYQPGPIPPILSNTYLCRPKRTDQMNQKDILAKARAAALWCQYATEHEKTHGGKSWSYLLISHDSITENKTLQGLASAFSFMS